MRENQKMVVIMFIFSWTGLVGNAAYHYGRKIANAEDQEATTAQRLKLDEAKQRAEIKVEELTRELSNQRIMHQATVALIHENEQVKKVITDDTVSIKVCVKDAEQNVTMTNIIDGHQKCLPNETTVSFFLANGQPEYASANIKK